MASPERPQPPTLPSAGEAGDQLWMDVIHKMDEVYNELLDYEVALEDKNAALEESQQFIVSVLTSMSDVLVVCNRQGVIEDVNPAMLALSGRSEVALKGSSVLDLFADEASRRRVQEHLVGHLNEPLHDCELVMRGADHSSVPVSFNCTPRYNAVGKMLGLVVTGRPVGDLRRAYRALHQAHEELKQTQQQLLHAEKMASLGRLVAGVAHELNNPISFVLGNVVALKRYVERISTYLDAVHDGAADLPQLRGELRIDRILADLPSLIEGTVEGAERTRDVVDGLKRFSATNRDETLTFDLVPVIERAAHWVGHTVSDRFTIRLDLPEPLPVLGASGQLQQVVMNLIQNASDATAGQERQSLEVVGRRESDRVIVTCHDNGPGIAPQNLARLFDPFFTTKPVGQGTGLGLSISYGIVERHRGHLEAANHPEGGAIFTLTLPLAEGGKAS